MKITPLLNEELSIFDYQLSSLLFPRVSVPVLSSHCPPKPHPTQPGICQGLLRLPTV